MKPDYLESLKAKGWVETVPGTWQKGLAVQYPPRETVRAHKRIRQSSKPLLNKLEQEFWNDYLSDRYPEAKPQALRFRLANGLTLTPDFVDLSVQPVKAWEVKGKHAWGDSLVKLKAAAAIWKDVRWILVWKRCGQWESQEVLA